MQPNDPTTHALEWEALTAERDLWESRARHAQARVAELEQAIAFLFSLPIEQGASGTLAAPISHDEALARTVQRMADALGPEPRTRKRVKRQRVERPRPGVDVSDRIAPAPFIRDGFDQALVRPIEYIAPAAPEDDELSANVRAWGEERRRLMRWEEVRILSRRRRRALARRRADKSAH